MLKFDLKRVVFDLQKTEFGKMYLKILLKKNIRLFFMQWLFRIPTANELISTYNWSWATYDA